MHLVIFVAPTFHFIKTLKDYFLWLFMMSLRKTYPNNGNRTLAPNTSKMINENIIWINYHSFLFAFAKILFAKPRAKNREKHPFVIKENWRSGAGDRARQARRGHGVFRGMYYLRTFT